MRRNPRPTFGMSLLLQTVTIVGLAVFTGIAFFFGLSRIDAAAGTGVEDEVTAGTIAGIAVAAVIPLAFSLVVSGFMQGIVSLEVARQTLGERLRFPQLWSIAKGRAWAVAGFTMLYAAVVVVAIGVLIGIVVALSLLGPAGIAVGVLLAIGAGLAIAVAFAWISTKLAFVPSIMMLERKRMVAAMARSWTLTGGSFWRLFGIILLVVVILSVAQSIITSPFQVALQLLAGLIAPTGDVDAIIWVAAGVYLVLVIVSVIVGAVTLVVQAASTAMLYIDQRMRKEGLDLDLVRFVEARQAGDNSVPDPFAQA
jgi:membrane-anchored glycerophosphoryl diester phosphodiesterase (GDPDase)